MSQESVSFATIGRSPSLVERVVDELTEAIVSGHFERGHRLPSERDLGDQFGVSRTVVREAVRALAARGLVTVTSGRGVEVAGVDAGTVADSMRMVMRGTREFTYEQVHEVRNSIEITAVELAARRATNEDLAELRRLCVEHAARIEEGDLHAASGVDFEFHRALAKASQNWLIVVVLDSVADVLHEVRDRAYATPGVAESGLDAHRQILARVAAHDENGAAEAMASHLSQAEQIHIPR